MVIFNNIQVEFLTNTEMYCKRLRFENNLENTGL
jgi:hypothetical protein